MNHSITFVHSDSHLTVDYKQKENTHTYTHTHIYIIETYVSTTVSFDKLNIPFPNSLASDYPMDVFHFHSYEDSKQLLPSHLKLKETLSEMKWIDDTNNKSRKRNKK